MDLFVLLRNLILILQKMGAKLDDAHELDEENRAIVLRFHLWKTNFKLVVIEEIIHE